MPTRTLQLIDELTALGFDDEAFAVIHHMPNVTIAAHRGYCEQTGSFQAGSNNEKVRSRLEIVLGAYSGGRFHSEEARNQVFAALAQAAVAEIPK